MLITQEFMNRLTPVEVAFIRAGIYKLCQDKIKHETTNYENLESKVERCPHCGSVHFVKNGFNPHTGRNTGAKTAEATSGIP